MAKGKYDEWLELENLSRLERWKGDGLTDGQIAQNMGISESTFYEWKRTYPEISEALKKGRDVVASIVENATMKNAKGYDYFEDTYTIIAGELALTKRVKKHAAGNATAQIFLLKNYAPDRFYDRSPRAEPTETDNGFMDDIIKALMDIDDDCTEDEASGGA
jgi:predicted DNA-binding protein (UPF0251 family)